MYFLNQRYHRYGLVILLLFVFSAPAAAEWKLNTQESALQFITSKLPKNSDTAILEENTFERFSATITQQQAVVSIDMTSVNTKVPIRDERIVQHVFQSKQYPTAQAVLNVKAAMVDTMKPGELLTYTVTGTLTLVKHTHPITADISIMRTADRLVVQTRKPILLDANQYELGEGFMKLRDIVSLFNIATTIPVTFYLVFERKL